MPLSAALSRKTVYGKTPWWDEDDPRDAARSVTDAVKSLEVWSYSRRFANLAFARLVSGRDLPTVYGLAMSSLARGTSASALDMLNFRAPTFNVIGSAVETLVNKLGRNRIWIKYLTSGADYDTRIACEKAEDYVEGIFIGAKVNREMKMYLQDALTWGTTWVKVHNNDPSDDKLICCERVIDDEILFDEEEAIYGMPRTLYQRRFVSRSVLCETYLERGSAQDQGRDRRDEIEAAIYGAQGGVEGLISNGAINHDAMVPVVEGWHIGEAKRGHVMGIGTTYLNPPELQKYEKRRFPFAKMNYNTPGFGWRGQGLAEVLAPHQKKINRLSEVIEEAQRRVAVPRWIVDKTTGLTAGSFANIISAVLMKNPGSPTPDCITPPAIQAEMYQDLEREIAKAYKRAGIPDDMAAGGDDERVRSGAAEKVRNDIRSQRFICTGQGMEDLGVDIADLALDLACDIKPVIKTNNGRDAIKWNDVKKALETATAKAFPISAFSTMPDLRLEQADRMLAAGQVSSTDYLRIIDYPDVKARTNLVTASANNIDRTIANNLAEDTEYIPPDKYMDVQLAFKTAHQTYEFERSVGMKPERLERLRVFIDQAQDLIEQLEAPAPAAQQSIVASGADGLEAQSTIGGAPAPQGLLPPMPDAAPTGMTGAGIAAAAPSLNAGAPS